MIDGIEMSRSQEREHLMHDHDDELPRHHDDGREERSPVLPRDPFDMLLSKLIGLPNGAHTSATTVQTIDDYGNVTKNIVQTVKTERGDFVFVEFASARDGFRRFILTPRTLATIDRQRASVTTQVRRRHGKRLAEERGNVNPFTPEMRRKALESRRRKARAKRNGAR
jgi:hypothetical protein